MDKIYSQELIEELIQSINIVDFISQYIELEQKSNVYMGICPFHEDTDASFVVYSNTHSYYCFGCKKTGNIIQFIMDYKKIKFTQAVKYLIDYTKFDIKNVKKEPETLKFLKQFNKKSKIDLINHDILSIDIMSKYSKKSIQEWLNEDIHQDIMDKYQVKYDEKSNRAVFPIFDINGSIINIKGRTLYSNYKELGIKKYMYYYPLGSNDFLYGLHLKRNIIKEVNEVIIVEGEKSLWKLEGWNINNVLSLCTSHLNEYQLRLLLELRCNIIIALDKGVLIKQIKEDFKLLSRLTNVYVIYDFNDLLKDKESPCDRGKEIFLKLYNNKIKI